MKGKVLLLVFCLLSLTGAFAQQYRLTGTKTLDFRSDALENAFEHYTVFKVDLAPFLQVAATHPRALDLRMEFEGLVSVQSQLKPSSALIAENYQTVVMDHGAARVDRQKPAAYPFLNKPGAETMAVTVANDLLYGTFEANGQTYYVEPVWYFDPAQPHNLFVVYDASDVKQSLGDFCGAMEVKHEKETLEDRGGQVNQLCGPPLLELAIANDYQMVTKFGSVTNVINHNIATMNAVQSNWDDDFYVPVPITITGQFVPASAGADPFPNSNSRDVLFNAFLNWAAGGGFGPTVFYDLAHWRSPRVIYNPSNQQILGAAGSNELCKVGRYAIFSEVSQLPACGLRTVTSHEMGHSFSATHTAVGSGDIMAGAYGGCTNIWAAVSVAQINAGIAAGTCMFTPSCPIPAGIAQPENLMTICTDVEECYTYPGTNPCIGGFSVTTNDPNIQITVTGLTICLKNLTAQSRIANVYVVPLDFCGNPTKDPSEPSNVWHVQVEYYPECKGHFQGNGEDRQINGEATDALRVTPSRDVVNIEDFSSEARNKEIRIFDQMGRQLLYQQNSDQRIQLPLDGYPVGILVVQVAAGDRIVTRKVAHF